MRRQLGWTVLALIYIINQTAFCEVVNPKREKEVIVEANKKELIGDLNLKEYSSQIKPEDCKDEITTCQLLVSTENQTECLLNPTYMKEKCKLTCRLCSPGRKTKRCIDLHEKCGSWSKNQDCLHYSAFMKNMCQKSCGLCTPGYHYRDVNVNCPQWGKAGFCNEKSSMKAVQKQCRHSCMKYKNRHFHLYHAPPVKHEHVQAKVKAIIHHNPQKHHHIHHATPKPITIDEKEELAYVGEEWAEEQEAKYREKAEQAKIEKEVNLKDVANEKSSKRSSEHSKKKTKKETKIV